MHISEGVTVYQMITQITELVNIPTNSTCLQMEIGTLQSKFNIYRCLIGTFCYWWFFKWVCNGMFCEIVLCFERMFLHVWMSDGISWETREKNPCGGERCFNGRGHQALGIMCS